MNEIRFEVKHSEYSKLIIPIIDGHSLISLLKTIELPFAKKEGHPEIAGAYGGIYFSESTSPTEYFLGQIETEENKGKTLLLLCDCSFEGCWDFLAKIIVHRSTVKWNDFEQIHRENWDYSGLGVFTFNRKQYENSLKNLEFEIGI
jgi:hypothetical protein